MDGLKLVRDKFYDILGVKDCFRTTLEFVIENSISFCMVENEECSSVPWARLWESAAHPVLSKHHGFMFSHSLFGFDDLLKVCFVHYWCLPFCSFPSIPQSRSLHRLLSPSGVHSNPLHPLPSPASPNISIPQGTSLFICHLDTRLTCCYFFTFLRLYCLLRLFTIISQELPSFPIIAFK